jgi:hypothetical protein
MASEMKVFLGLCGEYYLVEDVSQKRLLSFVRVLLQFKLSFDGLLWAQAAEVHLREHV